MISKTPKGSKFSFIKEQRQSADETPSDEIPAEPPSEAIADAPTPNPQPKAKSKVQPKAQSKVQPEVQPPAKPPAKPGRPKGGKRSDPDYEQITAYIRKDTHRAVKKLLVDEPDRDFSDLVQALLEAYLSQDG